MKLTNLEIYEYLSSLAEISEKVTGKLGYKVSYNMRKLSAEVPEYQKLRDETIEKYGEKNEEGIYAIKVGTDKYNEYVEEMKKYDDMTFDINILMATPEEFDDCNLTAKDMINIQFMIDDKDKDEES